MSVTPALGKDPVLRAEEEQAQPSRCNSLAFFLPVQAPLLQGGRPHLEGFVSLPEGPSSRSRGWEANTPGAGSAT